MREVPLFELTIRKYEKPMDLTLRQLSKRTCLSLGLLQLEDKRDVIVDVLYCLIELKEPKKAEEITTRVKEIRIQHGLNTKGCASSNIRRQLRRLREVGMVRAENALYCLPNEILRNVFEDRIEGFQMQTTLSRIKEYLDKIDEARSIK